MSKKKILFVDDEEDLCQIMKLNLELTDKYEVRTETKETKVFAAVREFRPDLIVLDIVFESSDFDGGDVEKQLQCNQITKDIPIIFLTALVTNEDMDKDNDFRNKRCMVGKPITPEQLIEIIELKIGR